MRFITPFGMMPAILVLGSLGCGGNTHTTQETAQGEAEPAKAGIKSYEITDLPPVDEPLQRPLDGGRLEICPPAEWGFFSQANYLVVFAKGRVSELPRLTVAVAESPYGADDTSEENAPALARDMQKRLVKDKKIVREKPKPLMLGGQVWVRHVRQVSQGGSPCAVQSLQTVRDGRLYTLELFSAAKDDSPGSMDAAVTKHRDHAYAVAANARFKKLSADRVSPSSPEEKPVETPAAEKPTPAAEKPAAEKPAGENQPNQKPSKLRTLD